MNEVVSIITPSFNRAELVIETAESILTQTYPYWEWVIVDDGSTDNTWEVLQSLAEKDNRIKLFKRMREPKGACACRNIAVEKCTGTYLIFLDTDDLMAPFCLEQRVKAMQKQPECGFIIFPMLLFKKQINDTNLLWNIDKDEDDLMRLLINDPICPGTGTLWKKKKFQEVGLWREDLKMWQDIELHIRSLLWPVNYAKRMDLPPDVYVRASDDSLSRVGYNSIPKLKSRVEIFFYACNRLKEKNLLPEYKEGLRKMGCEAGLSLIFQRQLWTGLLFLQRVKQFEIFTREEVSYLRKFLLLRCFNFSRINFLNEYYFQKNEYYYQKVTSIMPKTNESICTIPYNPHQVQKIKTVTA